MNFKLFLPLVVSIFIVHSAYALLTDSGQSTNNTFSAAEVFQSISPTPTITPTPTPSPSPSPTNIANHIVISEVQIATGSSTTDDFIELYNPTASAINLNGFRLVMRTSGGSVDTNVVIFNSIDSIAAHGFLLWCNSGFVSLTCDKTSTDTVSNNNTIALRNGLVNTGTIIDALTIGSPASPLGEGTAISAPALNSSVERKAQSGATSSTMGIGGSDEFKGNGFDTDDNSSDLVLRTTSQPQNSSSPLEIP